MVVIITVTICAFAKLMVAPRPPPQVMGILGFKIIKQRCHTIHALWAMRWSFWSWLPCENRTKWWLLGKRKAQRNEASQGAELVNSAAVLSLMFGIRSSLLTVYGFTIDWEFAVWENEDLYNARLNKWWIIDLADLTTPSCKYHRMFYPGSNLVSWASWPLIAFYYKG